MGAPDDAVLWAHPVFSVGDATFTWADVARFAQRGTGWSDLRGEIHEALACRRAGHAPSSAAVDQAARAFRYDRRLITADETEAWLSRRGLDVDGWMDYIRRQVVRAERAERGDELRNVVEAHPVPDEEVDALAWVHGWCSGRFEQLAHELAQRVAACVRLSGAPPADLAELDDVLPRFRDNVVTPEAVHAVVTRQRLDWLRVELDEAVFDNEGAAREAALSVRYDGLSLSEVSALAGARHRRRTVRLEELDADLRSAVLGAGEGDLAGPIASEGFLLVHVRSKTLPSVEDPDVRDRAVDLVTSTALRHEVEERVRWHDR